MNTEQLRADAAAAMLDAPIDPAAVPRDMSQAPAPDAAAMADGYSLLAGAALGMTFDLTCPAWEITDHEKTDFADALGKACAIWFPGEIPEKWVALIVVAGVGARIVAARRDPVTGGLKPRFKPIPEPQPAPVAA